MKLAVIGTGYVGLTTGTCLAELGNDVTCVDIDQDKINQLNRGIPPIYEPGLEELIKRNLSEGRLNFSLNSSKAIQDAEIVISAVGTPPGKNHKADLQNVEEVARTFGRSINNYKVFVNKSTVPVGTGSLCRKIIQRELDNRGVKIEFDAVSNPEFLREGSAIKDTLNPDRIIIGHESERAKELMSKLYRPFTEKDTPLLFTDLRSAEIIKYAANSLLATKISFINELANFCEKSGGDVNTVSKGIGLDKRIGKRFLNPGIGYGGSCLPKDVKAFIQTGKDFGHDFKILKAVDDVNEFQKEILFHKLQKQIPNLEGKTIAIWGLAFKPGTDDMREAPSINIINKLQQQESIIKVFDPVATKNAKQILPDLNITYSSTAYEAVKNADALMILTEWSEFLSPDLEKIKDLMNGNLILDGRNILQKTDVENFGFNYICIGQAPIEARKKTGLLLDDNLVNPSSNNSSNQWAHNIHQRH